MTWPTKKLGEMECVLRFLRNCNIKFDKNEILPNEREDDVVDVVYRNRKFQIVKADFEFQKLLGITPSRNGIKIISWRGRSEQDILRDFIFNPVKKKDKYGRTARGVILVLDSYRTPPWIEQKLEIFRKFEFEKLKTLGFDEIYLVCPNKNIEIYP